MVLKLPSTKEELLAARKESLQWLIAKISVIKNQSAMAGFGSINPMSGGLQKNVIGNMYMYVYDPKHKKTLPYYDKFPLCLPFSFGSGHFIGINLHYIPPNTRLNLLNKLLDFSNNSSLNDKTKLNLTYDLLASTKRYKEFEPCIHMYLDNHIRTNMLKILPHEWMLACCLPYEDFEKKTKIQVWKESRDIINRSTRYPRPPKQTP